MYPYNLIMRVLTICLVKLTQSTALEQMRFDLRSLSPALPNLWLLLVNKIYDFICEHWLYDPWKVLLC